MPDDTHVEIDRMRETDGLVELGFGGALARDARAIAPWSVRADAAR